MRIKFLLFIASFFMVPFIITSCLGNDSDIEYSTDATIHAFELDTVGYGITYKFTIDQIKGEIYNEDSLPVHADTIINSILIKTLTTASGVITIKNKEDKDSIISISDSIDFTKHINAPQEGEYLKLTSWAPDLLTKKEYKISVRVHRQVPDSLNWGKEPIVDNPIDKAGKQKLVISNDKMYLFTENSDKVYTLTIPAGSTPINPSNYGGNWQEEIANLPQKAKISSIINFMDNLYLVTEDGEVYNSNTNDELSWVKNEALSEVHVTDLITSYSDNDGSNHNKIVGIAGIVEVDGKKYFNFAEKAIKWASTNTTTEVPAEFPVENLSADVYSTESGTLNGVVVGNTQDGAVDDATVVWVSENGKEWYPMSTNNNCPKLKDPSIIHYNDAFYICGKENKDDAKGFQKFYTSQTLLVWKDVDKMFMLPGILPPVVDGNVTQYPSSPYGFKGKDANYSIIVDRNHFIWMVGGNGIDKIWRGRVNKLGFLIQ